MTGDEFSALDIAVFAAAVAMIMAFHGWFFFYTSIRPSRPPPPDPLLDEDILDLEDHRRAREMKTPPGGDR